MREEDNLNKKVKLNKDNNENYREDITEFERKEFKVDSTIDESTLENMKDDPLRNKNINDTGVIGAELRDLSRVAHQGDGLSRDNIDRDKAKPDNLDLSNINQDKLDNDDGFVKDNSINIKQRNSDDI